MSYLLSDKIAKILNDHKISQTKLGQIAGVNHAAVNNWLSGGYEPKGLPLLKIARHFGYDVESLIDESVELRNFPQKTILTSTQIYPDYLTLSIDDIKYFPQSLMLGGKTSVGYIKELIKHAYHIYEITLDNEIFKLVGKTLDIGIDKYLIIDNMVDKSYPLANYKHVFIGSIVSVQLEEYSSKSQD